METNVGHRSHVYAEGIARKQNDIALFHAGLETSGLTVSYPGSQPSFNMQNPVSDRARYVIPAKAAALPYLPVSKSACTRLPGAGHIFVEV